MGVDGSNDSNDNYNNDNNNIFVTASTHNETKIIVLCKNGACRTKMLKLFWNRSTGRCLPLPAPIHFSKSFLYVWIIYLKLKKLQW